MSSVEQQMDHQFTAIHREARRAGLEVIEREEVLSREASTTGGRVGSMVTGQLKLLGLQSVVLRGPHGESRLRLPYTNLGLAAPEYQAQLSGSLPASVRVVPSRFATSRQGVQLLAVLTVLLLGLPWLLGWGRPSLTSPDPAVSQRLRRDRALRRALRRLKPRWRMGARVQAHEWLVQVRPLGDGRSDVVMAVGFYWGTRALNVGVSAFSELCAALSGVLEPTEHPARPFLDAPRYAA